MPCPAVRKIWLADLKDAVAEGVADFTAMPTHAIFLAIIYPLVGLFLARLSFGYDMVPFLAALVAGFALIGPFAALSLYELSRLREQKVAVTWAGVLSVVHCPSLGAIAALGTILMVVFLLWLAVAAWLYWLLFGDETPASLEQFLADLATTPEGWTLLAAGSGIGALFAGLVLTISVVSFPLLLDRNVGATVAMRTSLRVARANPLTIAVWGAIVAVVLVLGSLPLFVGLAVAMPLLAHSSWHLYRKAVAG